MKRPAVICDLDGTLCNTDHRKHYIEGVEKKNWIAFNAACDKDQPNKWCQTILNGVKDTHVILFVTGRANPYELTTFKWLNDNGMMYHEYYLYMRSDSDHRDDTTIKRELYEKFIKDMYDVEFVLEDRKRVVDMWRSLGLTCLQCAPGEF